MSARITLANATPEQIQEALESTPAPGTLHHCRWCHITYKPARNWQEFCSTKCRNLWHNGAWQREADRLAARVRVLEGEKAELLKELGRRET